MYNKEDGELDRKTWKRKSQDHGEWPKWQINCFIVNSWVNFQDYCQCPNVTIVCFAVMIWSNIEVSQESRTYNLRRCVAYKTTTHSMLSQRFHTCILQLYILVSICIYMLLKRLDQWLCKHIVQGTALFLKPWLRNYSSFYGFFAWFLPPSLPSLLLRHWRSLSHSHHPSIEDFINILWGSCEVC